MKKRIPCPRCKKPMSPGSKRCRECFMKNTNKSGAFAARRR